MEKLVLMRFKTKQEFAYDALREAIVTGELPPGERLIISSLANDFGISEIPIREALKRLESEGLIVRSGQSFTVSTISIEETIELLSVRLELEGMAIRRATKNIDAEGIQELEKVLLEMEEAIQTQDGSAFGRLNKEFHSAIYEYCGVDVLVRAIKDAWNQSERARYIFRVIPGRAAASASEHREIIKALQEKRVNDAEAALIGHLKQSFDLFAEQLLAKN